MLAIISEDEHVDFLTLSKPLLLFSERMKDMLLFTKPASATPACLLLFANFSVLMTQAFRRRVYKTHYKEYNTAVSRPRLPSPVQHSFLLAALCLDIRALSRLDSRHFLVQPSSLRS